MRNETDQLIIEQFEKLPTNLRKAIENTAWEFAVQEIGKKSNLSTEQIETLEREVVIVLYAFEPMENLSTNISKELEISEETAESISQSVWENIIEPIGRKASGSEQENSRVPEIAPEIHPVVQVDSVPENKPAEKVSWKDKMNDIPNNIGRITPLTSLEALRNPFGTSLDKKPQTDSTLATTAEGETKLPASDKEKKVEENKISVPDYRYPDGVDPYREPAK